MILNDIIRALRKPHVVSGVCSIGVVIAGFLELREFSLLLATLCTGLILYEAAVCGTRLRAAKLLFLSSASLALAVLLFRETLRYGFFWHVPFRFWQWFPRVYSAMILSKVAAIILAFVAAGLALIETAGKIGGETIRKRFQWMVVGSASILLAINVPHFLRHVTCYDCFFPYGLPFTLFTEGGYGGGGGIVWSGLLADAAIVPIFATISTLLWNQTRRHRRIEQ